jgi:hypothetical protein
LPDPNAARHAPQRSEMSPESAFLTIHPGSHSGYP